MSSRVRLAEVSERPLSVDRLLALVSDQAEAQDLSLERAAKKFTAVEVPENSQGWRWHPWLGITKQH